MQNDFKNTACEIRLRPFFYTETTLGATCPHDEAEASVLALCPKWPTSTPLHALSASEERQLHPSSRIPVRTRSSALLLPPTSLAHTHCFLTATITGAGSDEG